MVTLQMHYFIVASPSHTYPQCQSKTKATISLGRLDREISEVSCKNACIFNSTEAKYGFIINDFINVCKIPICLCIHDLIIRR